VLERVGTFLDKARESLEDAREAYRGGRYNNSGNRSYYACLQAAIHALIVEQISPPGRGTNWDHGFVHGQFNGMLIHRRQRYTADLRTVLSDNYEVRVQADYTPVTVSETVASRALRRAERFVAAVARETGGPR
jgi:uncharacterized protein (UPF0332 family)